MSESEPDVLIVGGGAAGATCALYLGRAGMSVVVIDQDRTTLKRAELHNFPGLEPMAGLSWLSSVRQQAAGSGDVIFREGRVLDLSTTDDGSVTVDADFGRVQPRFVVIASGQGTTPFLQALGVDTTEAIQPFVKTNIVTDRWGETRIPRVFAIGVVAGHPSQAVICAGSGANAAIRIACLEKGVFWVDHDSPPNAS